MTLEPVPDGETSPSPSGETLEHVVRDQLERQLRRRGTGPTISVLGVADERATLLRHGFDRPADIVLGFVLPSDFGAVAAVAASVIAREGRLAHGHLAIAVDRNGAEVCMVATDDGFARTHRPCGWLADACRRSVRLATRPENAHPLRFPLSLWMDRLMVEIVHAGRPVTWSQALSCCPVPARWSSGGPLDLGTTLASITPSWHRLRAAVACGGPLPVPVEPAHAAWMDDAMFARWCLGFFPDYDDLRADLEFIAPAAVAAAVDLTIDAAHAVFST